MVHAGTASIIAFLIITQVSGHFGVPAYLSHFIEDPPFALQLQLLIFAPSKLSETCRYCFQCQYECVPVRPKTQKNY